MKKLLSCAAIAALLSSVAPVHHAFAAGANDLVKCPDFSSVYYIGDDGNRYVFPNENMYFSWYPDFRSVKTISCDSLAAFPIGERLVYQSGTSLVKIPSDPSVYAVESDGVLREIPDEDTAKKLFGDDWSTRVDDVSEAFWSSFTVGAPLADGEIPQGTILDDGTGKLYKTNADGTATEIDAVLDTDEEEVLKEHALPLDDIEARLGVALALTKVDAQAAIEVLQQIIADLRPVDVKAEDVETVEDVSEIEDSSGNKGDAENAILDAQSEIDDATASINESKANGTDVTAQEAFLDSAKTMLATAEASLAAGDYASAETTADDARHEAQRAQNKAVDLIEGIDDSQDTDKTTSDSSTDTQDSSESNDSSADSSGSSDSSDSSSESDSSGASDTSSSSSDDSSSSNETH